MAYKLYVMQTQDDRGSDSPEITNLYLQFDMVLSDVSAFLVDGEYGWAETSLGGHPGTSKMSGAVMLPVMDKCGVVLRLQQVSYSSFPGLDFPISREYANMH